MNFFWEKFKQTHIISVIYVTKCTEHFSYSFFYSLMVLLLEYETEQNY